LAIAALGFAWYKLLSNKQGVACDADGACVVEKKSFLASKTFLSIITIAAIVLMAFPLYAKIFYPTPVAPPAVVGNINSKQQVEFTIKGMSCQACEVEVDNEVSKINGVIGYKTSYANHSSIVTFDTAKATISTIEKAINNTGYIVKNYKIISVKK
jgi:copper chaperone CopZ